jgi:hypothetical protein
MSIDGGVYTYDLLRMYIIVVKSAIQNEWAGVTTVNKCGEFELWS